MGTTVEELDYELSFNWDSKKFDKFNASLKKSIGNFAKLGSALIAAQTASFIHAKGVAEQIDGLDKLSSRLGVTSEQYQQLSFAAQDFGADASDVESSLQALTKAQEDVLLGKGDLEAFGRLGINPADFQNSADLLLAVSDSISTIQRDSEKISLLNRIGVSTDLLQTLEGGSDAIRALSADFDSLGATITEDQKKVAGEFQAVWLRTTTIIGGASRKVGVDSLKTINKFLNKFVKFAQKNMKQIIEGFEKFFNAISKATTFLFEVLNRIFTLVSRIVSLMGGLENAVIAASVAFVVLKRRMLLSFAIPLAVATALFLVIEDIVSALEGKDSLFGDFLDSVGQFPQAMEAVGLHISNFIDKILALLKGIEDFFSNDIGNFVGNIFGGGQAQAQTINNNGGARNANVNVTVNGADGNVISQLNTYFQQLSNSILGE